MEKEKVTLKNIIAYLQGNFRYRIFYSRYFHWLMREHIREQIEYRIHSMNRECFERGSCIKCGCQTTHLQMANKACKGDCYPSMIDKYTWDRLQRYRINIIDLFEIDMINRKFIKQ